VTASQTALLAGIVAIAFLVEAAAGFGSMVVALTVGSLFFPLPSLLGWLVPVNVVLSCYLLTRGREHLDWKFLLSSVAPLMTSGLLVGILIARSTDTAWLKPVFALFVVGVAAHQLAAKAAPAPLSRPVASVVLFAGGVVHGVFATGGPLTVFVASRTLPNKSTFRATLAAIWVLLNVLLLPRLWLDGTLSLQTLPLSALMLLPLGLGILAGEWVHHRLAEETFRRVVSVLLLAAGGTLLVTSLKARFG
jgi:uncharacterized membrane protein YfcA